MDDGNILSAYLNKERKKTTAVNTTVQVTKFIGRYIRDYVGASQSYFSDPQNHPPLDDKWIDVRGLQAERTRLQDPCPLKCKVLKSNGEPILEYIKEDGDKFTVRQGDVVRCKNRVFGKVILIDVGIKTGVMKPSPRIHLHLWQHEMDGPLGPHAHPKRLYQTEACRRDLAHDDVVEKLVIVEGHVKPGFHPVMRGENSYICTHR
jgi:hypothetical protein